MALAHPNDTDERAVPAAVRRFFRNRLLETAGLVILSGSTALALALASWSPVDPAFDPNLAAPSANYLGAAGAHMADGLIRAFGLAAILGFAVPMAWGASLLSHHKPTRIFRRLLSWTTGLLAAAALLSFLSAFTIAPLTDGPGGSAGRFLADLLTSFLGLGLKPSLASWMAGILFGVLAISGSLRAGGFDDWRSRLTARLLGERAHDLIESTYGWITHSFITLRQSLRKSAPPPAMRTSRKKLAEPEMPKPSFWSFLWRGQGAERVEPRLSGTSTTIREPRLVNFSIKNLTHRIHRLQSHLGEYPHHFFVNQIKPLNCLFFSLCQIFHGLQRTLKIIHHRQHAHQNIFRCRLHPIQTIFGSPSTEIFKFTVQTQIFIALVLQLLIHIHHTVYLSTHFFRFNFHRFHWLISPVMDPFQWLFRF